MILDGRETLAKKCSMNVARQIFGAIRIKAKDAPEEGTKGWERDAEVRLRPLFMSDSDSDLS